MRTSFHMRQSRLRTEFSFSALVPPFLHSFNLHSSLLCTCSSFVTLISDVFISSCTHSSILALISFAFISCTHQIFFFRISLLFYWTHFLCIHLVFALIFLFRRSFHMHSSRVGTHFSFFWHSFLFFLALMSLFFALVFSL